MVDGTRYTSRVSDTSATASARILFSTERASNDTADHSYLEKGSCIVSFATVALAIIFRSFLIPSA
jgi:hypothetical protein